MSSLKVSGLTAQGAASADDLLYLVDTEDGGNTYASKSITVGNFLNGYATESFVSTQLDALVNGAPAALDTLKELSDALGADSNFSTTITNLISANEVHVDNMATLTGVAKDDTTLGTFTGSTIGDSVDIKSALQALETSLETKGDATLLSQTTSKANDLVLLSGMPAGSGNLGTFTGSTISDDTTVKSALQELETEIARVDADITTQINAVDLSGIATNAGNIATLQVDLNTEAAARAAADTAEAAARTNADSALSNRLDSLEADPTTGTALSSEASTRAAADTLLSGRLDALEADPTTQTLLTAEATARTSADSTLQSNIDAEEAARIAADNTLTTNLSQEVTDRTAAVTAEATARSAADTTLQSNIDAEEAARIAADNTLTTNLAQEVSDRAAAVTAEATARSSADTTLQSNIDSEEAARIAAVSAEETARIAADALKLDLAGGTMSGAIQMGASTGGSNWNQSQVWSNSLTSNGTIQNASSAFDADLSTRAQTDNYGNGLKLTFAPATGVSFTTSLEVYCDQGTEIDPGMVAPTASWNGNSVTPGSGQWVTVYSGSGTIDASTPLVIDTETAGQYATLKGVRLDGVLLVDSTVVDPNAGPSPSTIGVDGTASFSGLISAATAPTADEHLTNKAYVDSKAATNAAAIESLTNGAPELLNTLNELADAIGDDENFATTVTNQIAAETSARQASDVTLQSNIDSEAAARSGADTTLQSNIDAEETARIAADSTLTTNLAQEVTDRTAAVSAEASARAAADALLLPLAGGTMSGAIQMGAAADITVGPFTPQEGVSLYGSGEPTVTLATGSGTIESITFVADGNNSEWFALYVDDVLVNDASLGQYVTGAGFNGNVGDKAFDSSASTKAQGASNSTMVFTPATPIPYTSKVQVKIGPYNTVTMVNGEAGGMSVLGVDGTASFSGLVSASSVPTADAHLVNKLYADNLVAGVDLSGIATNAANLAQEITDRQAGDSSLQAAINAEEAARIAADAQLLQLTGGSMAGPIDFGGVTTINPDGSADFSGLISADSVPTLPQHLTNKLYVDTQLAVNAAAIEAVVGGAPELLNTLNELAEAISDDENFATTVTNSIATESSARSSADVTLQSNIDAEAASRVAADNLLTVNLNTEITDRQLADTTETAARIAADNTLTTNLATEVSDRQSAVAAEEAARIAADNTLTANLNQEISDRQTAITNESSARATADTTLQSNIDAEAASRIAADNTLTTNLAQEVSDRTAAVSAEETARIAADTAEASARAAADALLLPLAGGTMSGAIVMGQAAGSGTTGACYFDGNDHLEMPDSSDFDLGLSGEAFTIETFVYPTATNEGTIFNRGGGFAGWNNTNGHQISLYTYQNRLYFEWWSGSAYNHVKTEPGAGIVVGSWQHVAVAYSGGTVKVYIDGSEVLSSAATFGKPSNSNITRIGLSSSVQGYWNGYMSNFRICKGHAVYTENFTVPTTELTAHPETVLLCCQSATDPEAEASGNTTVSLAGSDTSATDAGPGLTVSGGTSAGSTIAVDGTATFSGLISASTAPTADEHLTNKLYVDSKAATNAAAIEALSNGAPELLNTLNELANAINDDENFSTTVTNQIAAETTARQASDVTLQSNIDSEAAARSGADTTLQSNIDTESAARIAADTAETNARTAAVSAEETARIAADALLLPLAGGTMSGAINLGESSSDSFTFLTTPGGEQNVHVSFDNSGYSNVIQIHSSAGSNAGSGLSIKGSNNGSQYSNVNAVDENGVTTVTTNFQHIQIANPMSSDRFNDVLTITLMPVSHYDSAEFSTREHTYADMTGYFHEPVLRTGTITTASSPSSVLGVDGTATFGGLVTASSVPTADAHLVNKLYADNLVAGVDLSGIATNAANLTQEIADRQAGDAAEATARANAIAAEAASRSSADTTLQSNIDAEATARAAAITALTNGAVAQNTAAIAAEVNTDRDAAITVAINALTNGAVATNTANLTQEIADRIAQVNAETAAREAAVTGLQNSLSSTNSSVTANVNAIAAEETARIAADTVLTNGKVDKQSSVNVHMVGETAAASTPVDAQGVDNYLFLVVDKATGAIKSIEKSFLEAEQLGTAGATFAFTPTVTVDGNGHTVSYQIFTPGTDLFDGFGIDRVGDLSSDSIIIHFKDLASLYEWRTTDRTIVFTAADNDFYAWEGSFNLNSEGEDTEESDGYTSAIVQDINEAVLLHGYSQSIVDEDSDTTVVNDYSGAELDIHVEYSFVNIGLGTTNGLALSNFVSSAGTGNSVIDITVKPGRSNH